MAVYQTIEDGWFLKLKADVVGKSIIAQCEHLLDEQVHVPPDLLVPVGDGKYVLICRKCSASLRLGILEDFAGIKRLADRLPGLTAIVPDEESKVQIQGFIARYGDKAV